MRIFRLSFSFLLLTVAGGSLAQVELVELTDVQKIGDDYSFEIKEVENMSIYIPPNLKAKYPAEVLQAIADENKPVTTDYSCQQTEKALLQEKIVCTWKEVLYSASKVGMYWDEAMKTESVNWRIGLIFCLVALGLLLLSNLLMYLMYKKLLLGEAAVAVAAVVVVVAVAAAVVAVVAAVAEAAAAVAVVVVAAVVVEKNTRSMCFYLQYFMLA